MTQVVDATVLHGNVVGRRPSSSFVIDHDFVIHNLHSTPPLILIVLSIGCLSVRPSVTRGLSAIAELLVSIGYRGMQSATEMLPLCQMQVGYEK